MRTYYQHGSLIKESRKRTGIEVWVFRYNDGGKRRKQILGTVKQLTPSQAERAAASIRSRINGGPQQSVLTFGVLLERYLVEDLPQRTRETSRRQYMPWINRYILPKWKTVPAQTIVSRPIVVEEWLKSITGLAPTSKVHIRAIMKSVFEHAVRCGVLEIARNPMELVRIKGSGKSALPKRVIMPEEFARLLKLLPYVCRVMAIVAYGTGMRISEIVGLQWGDVDFDRGVITIARGVVYGVVGDPKSASSGAMIPMSDGIAEVLRAHRARLLSPSEWIFPSPMSSGPISGRHYQTQYIEPASRAVGLGAGVGWHNFRHSFSTLHNSGGTDPKVIQRLMRHSDLSTTMNVYTQALPADVIAAQARFEKIAMPALAGQLLDPNETHVQEVVPVQ